MSTDFLTHSGTPHEGPIPHSGRYPYGSGEHPFQRPKDFLAFVADLENQGLSIAEVAKGCGLSIRELRAQKSLAKSEVRVSNVDEAVRLKNAGFGASEIGRKLGVNESTVRSWLDSDISNRQAITAHTADTLAKEVSRQKYIDVGLGTAETMGITSNRLDTAVEKLKSEGYEVHKVTINQPGSSSNQTVVKVLAAPGTSLKEVRDHITEIGIVNAHYKDPNGITFNVVHPIKSISSKRIQIAYREDGGAEKDGVIELRRGAEGLDLGQARYAQVRIGVDGTHFLKGMAMYADDLPDGIDIRFNTNKSKADPKQKTKLDALKPMETHADGSINQENPFKAYIKPGGQRGYLNIVREEGDWSSWSKNLASQMLGKQPVALAKKQLELTRAIMEQEYDEISSLTNPTIKKYFLNQFADSCDRAAVHLKAAAMPRQASKVLLPLNSISPNQIYAPGFDTGERVVLIRYPHGGIFEIPELTVNNRNREAIRLFKNAQDAVGVHSSVAARLSGADFDGDTVVVIPNNNKRIINSSPLAGLKDFDPKLAYPERKGMSYMSEKQTQSEMGKISNLITDMTLMKAPTEHIVRAVRHSMVVIDAHKHKLDYRQSEKDNNIDELRRLYQKKIDENGNVSYGGATTLLSRAKAPTWVGDRYQKYGNAGIDPETGEKVYNYTGKMKYNYKTGKLEPWQIKSSQMYEARDAKDLLSLSPKTMEIVYANHANKVKALANKARKDILATNDIKWNAEARATYKNEIESLRDKVRRTVQHQPYERKAQAFADAQVKMMRADKPNMTYEESKKIRTRALIEARARLGGKRDKFLITDREWKAIQSGAVSKTMLTKILTYADQDALKERALPKVTKGLTSAQLSLARLMEANNYTQKEIADRLGVSASTVSKALSDQ